MNERRLIALALIVAGVWVQWGPGFALIVAGVGYGAAGVELAPRVAAATTGVGRAWARARAVAAAVPRQTAAAVLVSLAVAVGSTAAFMAVGLWAAFVVVAAGSAVVGGALGWE